VAVELCGQVAGADLPRHEASEYLLADFLSGCRHREAADGSGPGRDACRVELPDGDGDHAGASDLAERRPDGTWPEWWDESWVADELGPAFLDSALSAEAREALQLLDGGFGGGDPPEDPFALDESLRALVRARSSLDLDLARLLRQVHSLGLARHLGFPSFAAYVEARVGISPRRARFLVALDRKLTRLPALEEAVRAGRVGTVAAQLVGRVAEHGMTDEAWIDRAKRVTVAQLRRDVDLAEGRDRLGRERGFPMPPSPGGAVTALDEMTDSLAASLGPTSAAAPASLPGAGVAWPTFAMREDDWVSFELPLRRSTIPLWTEAGLQLALAIGGGPVTDDRLIRTVALEFLAGYLPLWLDEVVSGDPIAVREHFRCAVPGCSVRSGSAHHIQFRSRGGGDEPSNLVFLCYRHHLLCLHELGSLRVSGRAPGDLLFELGVRPGGGPLEAYRGAVRVPLAEAASVGVQRGAVRGPRVSRPGPRRAPRPVPPWRPPPPPRSGEEPRA
jgi:hypothetical protein